MGGGNGAKSAQARERNAAKAGKVGNSTLKSNIASQTIQCKVCFNTFQGTAKEPELKLHADNKHPGKGFAGCFPDFGK